MSLGDRISNGAAGGENMEPQHDGTYMTQQSQAQQGPVARDRLESAFDRQSELKSSIHALVIRDLGARLYNQSVPEAELRRLVRSKIEEGLATQHVPMPRTERQELIDELMAEVLGYGPIEEFLQDPTITEIMCNGYRDIYIERGGKIFKTDKRFRDEGHMRRIIQKIVGQVGRRVDESSPYVDARLPDGSRVNVILPPLSVRGPALTIRKFSAEPYTTEDLIEFKTLTKRAADFLKACVRGRLNILVSGGTGVGKTTTLNVLSSYIPPDERIITIEDAAELKLSHEHIVSLEYRPPNIEGKGEVTIRDLVRNALRMRPDRIIVGEIRGGEALDMLQAMNTGHDGSLSTVHANSPRDALSRVETMVLMAGMDLPVRAIREQISRAIHLIVHQARLADGTRRITQITEITGMEGDVITLQNLFVFDFAAGISEDGQYLGRLKSTGIRPSFLPILQKHGVTLPDDIFAFETYDTSLAL
ncbi:MAG: CpaF family protein [Thermoleophilia bacterium]|nr:CpaF family protein [Thermoleophilia bacterium]